MPSPPGNPARPPASRPRDAEEDDIDLPPLDADGDDGEEEEAGYEDLIAPLEDGADGLDDVSAADLDVGVELGDDDLDATGGDEAAEGDIDVGPLDEDIVDDDDAAAQDESLEGVGGEDDDLEAADDGEDDGGAEGTDDPIEDAVNDADLPELDADDDGDYGAGAELEEAVEAADGTLPPWSDARWVVREGAGAAVPCSAVAVGAGRVAAAGDVVLLVGEGAHAAHRASFGSGGTSVAIADGAVLVATARGGLLASVDDGASAAPLPSWRTRRDIADVQATPGRAWILSSGELWTVPAPTAAGAAVAARTGVVAIASSGGALVALARHTHGPAIERLRGDDEGWQSSPLDGDARRIAEGTGVRLAAGGAGRLVAIASPSEGLAISRDAGQSFLPIPLSDVLDLAFAGEDADAPLVVVVARQLESAAYVVLVPPDAEPARVAELASSEASGDEDDPLGAVAIAWDPARDLLWIASRAGLYALGRARRH